MVDHSALEENHASQLVSDDEDEGMINIEHLVWSRHRPHHHHHSSSSSSLASLLIDLDKDFLNHRGDIEVLIAGDAGEVSFVREHVRHPHLLETLRQGEALGQFEPGKTEVHLHVSLVLREERLEGNLGQLVLQLKHASSLPGQDELHHDPLPLVGQLHHGALQLVQAGEVHLVAHQAHHLHLLGLRLGCPELLQAGVVLLELSLPVSLEVDSIDRDQPRHRVQAVRRDQVRDLVPGLGLHPVVDHPGGLLVLRKIHGAHGSVVVLVKTGLELLQHLEVLNDEGGVGGVEGEVLVGSQCRNRISVSSSQTVSVREVHRVLHHLEGLPSRPLGQHGQPCRHAVGGEQDVALLSLLDDAVQRLAELLRGLGHGLHLCLVFNVGSHLSALLVLHEDEVTASDKEGEETGHQGSECHHDNRSNLEANSVLL